VVVELECCFGLFDGRSVATSSVELDASSLLAVGCRTLDFLFFVSRISMVEAGIAGGLDRWLSVKIDRARLRLRE
jgi:hypothetical protein